MPEPRETHAAIDARRNAQRGGGERYRPGPSAVSGGASICNDCGCLVYDQAVHDMHHAEHDDAVRDGKRARLRR